MRSKRGAVDTPRDCVYNSYIQLLFWLPSMAGSAEKLLVAFRKADNRFGVTRATLTKLARQLGLNETQVIHYALSQLANDVLPSYAPDNGPLTARELKVISKLAGGRHGKSIRSSLF
jgi:hypothetical protein